MARARMKHTRFRDMSPQSAPEAVLHEALQGLCLQPLPEKGPGVQAAEGILEEALGFPLFQDGEDKLGWLMNYNAVRPPHWPLDPGPGAGAHHQLGLTFELLA